MSTEIMGGLQVYIAKEILKQQDRMIDPNEPLLTSGLIDSFHLVDLGLFIENQYCVRIDDAELNAETFNTLTQLVELIKARK